MLTQTVTETNFRDAFYASDRGDSFSYEGIRDLYNYFEEDCENVTLDVIAICCEYSEQSLDDILASYTLTDRLDYDDDADYYEAAIEALHDSTIVITDTTNATGDTLIVFAEF